MRILVLFGVAAISACQGGPRAPVTPQRPTVSLDTNTTAAGTFELEAGASIDPGDAFDSPATLKFGTGEASELFLGLSPYQWLQQPSGDADGSSDLVIGARHRLWDVDGELPAAAVVLSGKLPTASVAGGQSTGETDLRLAAILNRSFGAINVNLFYQYGALGNAQGAGTLSEHTATVTLGLPIDDRWSSFVELGSITVPSQHLEQQFAIVGAAYLVEPWLVLDGGATIGLSEDAADLQLFVGATCNFGGIAQRR